MAYVIVQHLDPSHKSILPEILSRITNIPVNEITDNIHIAPDNIYVIPPNKTLISTDGILKLTNRDKKIQNLPIDVFFTSLAEVHQSLAVGVVLSGTASDGTLGLRAIKAHGGITFAQDQQSAAYGDMPKNAVNADVVDFVLPPEKIPEKLLEIIHAYKESKKEEQLPKGKDDEAVFKQILLILRQHSGVNFTYYKQTTIRRRIARRMVIHKDEKLKDYLKFLRKNKIEQEALFHDMLIPVTAFFRDPKIFETISEKVFPAIFKNKPVGEPIRIWVAGCSTGEEAYSLAILINEFLGEKMSEKQIQIFASDISETAISKARRGIYNKVELENVPPTLLKNYFSKSNGGFQLNRQIRDMCVFAVHNFLKDPPFSKMDLISCRNVLIYMETFLQTKALTTFHYALKGSGFLLLGKSEATSPVSDLFMPFAKNDKIYSRKSASGNFIPIATERKEEELEKRDKKTRQSEVFQTDFRKSAETLLLSKYTPASVIVNEQMDIVHIHGNTSPFLEPSQGKPTFNLMKMAREGLGFELRNTLHKAKTSQTNVLREGILIDINEKPHLVSIEIIPLLNTVEPYFLILFHKTLLPEKREKDGNESAGKSDLKEAKNRNMQLEKELGQTREDMRSITEDQEAANEELQSANEELLSNGEELQSLNEELETSKEEMQSTNEELVIVNQELRDKQEQLNASRLYSETIVANVREPLVILDKAICIKTANDSFYKKFNLGPDETEGKSLFEIANHLFVIDGLSSKLEKILQMKSRLDDYEIIVHFSPVGERILLLNARQIIYERDKEQLILLAIEDITERKVAERQMKTFSEKLEAMVKERTSELEQANLQLKQFAHTASHDFQEPMRKITMFSKILQKKQNEGKPEEVKEYLSKIEGAAVRMTKLIKDMLDFSSIKSHKQLFEKTSLNEIIKNILFDFELLIAEKKAQITCDNLPQIEAVPFQMNQLFYDLIFNALKFSKPHVASVIHISSRKITREEIKLHPYLNQKLRYYELIVKDNGIGFEQKYAKQIFVMFQRLNTGPVYAGTGIGLALCKKIVDNYHGEIFAEGRENKGATFHVILPVQQPKHEIKVRK